MRVRQGLSQRLDGANALDLSVRMRSDLLDVDMLAAHDGGSFVEVCSDAMGPVLLFGPPGSGKTTMLHILLSALLDRAGAETSEPIAELFQAGSWPGGSVVDWLSDELVARHGYAGQMRAWLVAGEFAVLIDGLDELPATRTPAFVRELRTFATWHTSAPLVVASRPDPPAEGRQVFCAALELMPVEPAQIEEYLSNVDERFRPVASSVMREPRFAELRELLSNPLLLRAAAQSFADEPADLLAALEEDRRKGPGLRRLWWSYFVEGVRSTRDRMDPTWSIAQCHTWMTTLTDLHASGMEKELTGGDLPLWRSERISAARFLVPEESSPARRGAAVASVTLAAAAMSLLFGVSDALPWLLAGAAGMLASKISHGVFLLLFGLLLANVPFGRLARLFILTVCAAAILLPLFVVLVVFGLPESLVLVLVSAFCWHITEYGPGVVEKRSRLTEAPVAWAILISCSPLVAEVGSERDAKAFAWAVTLVLLCGVAIRTAARPWLLCNVSRSLLPLRLALRRATRQGVVGALVSGLIVGILWLPVERHLSWAIAPVAALAALAGGTAAGLGWAIGLWLRRRSWYTRVYPSPLKVVDFLEWAVTARLLVRDGSCFTWFHGELRRYFAIGEWGSAIPTEPTELVAEKDSPRDPYSTKISLLAIESHLNGSSDRSVPLTDDDRARLIECRRRLEHELLGTGVHRS